MTWTTTATAFEDEPEDGENQDDGVMDDQPNELDDTLIIDESAGPSSSQPDDQIADGNGDNDGRQPEQVVENTTGDQAAVEAEVTSPRPKRQRQPPTLFARICSHRPRSGKSDAVKDRLFWMV